VQSLWRRCTAAHTAQRVGLLSATAFQFSPARSSAISGNMLEINDYESAIERGRKAWERLSKDQTWEDWMATGQALEILREQAMHEARTREATYA
jgi:hypothetical protein